MIFTKEITIRKYEKPVIERGRVVSPSFKDSTVTANVQPVSMKELEILPEGRRKKQNIKVWLESEIKIDDVIIDSGYLYEVFQVSTYSQCAPLPHSKVFASLKGKDS